MTGYRVNLPNFSKGEIGPELRSRVDVGFYNAGLGRARNVVIRKYGGVTKRMGTRLVAPVYDAAHPLRLLPFTFSLEQSYVLEMGQGYMRPIALGGVVLNEELAITGITKAASAVVSVAFHGYSIGDQVFFSGVQGMTQINGLTGKVVSVPSTGSFVVDIDTTGFGTFTGSTGGITRTGAPAPEPEAPPVTTPTPTPTPPPVAGGGGGGGGPRNPDEQIP